jgi:hypothetical protein
MTVRACASDQKLLMLTLIADAGIQRFDVAVAPRLAGRDEVQTGMGLGSLSG